jgi:hypothetical protein
LLYLGYFGKMPAKAEGWTLCPGETLPLPLGGNQGAGYSLNSHEKLKWQGMPLREEKRNVGERKRQREGEKEGREYLLA